MFAPPLDAAGESSVFTEVHTGRSSMMVFWVDKLLAKLVEALEDAVQLVRAILNVCSVLCWLGTTGLDT